MARSIMIDMDNRVDLTKYICPDCGETLFTTNCEVVGEVDSWALEYAMALHLKKCSAYTFVDYEVLPKTSFVMI